LQAGEEFFCPIYSVVFAGAFSGWLQDKLVYAIISMQYKEFYSGNETVVLGGPIMLYKKWELRFLILLPVLLIPLFTASCSILFSFRGKTMENEERSEILRDNNIPNNLQNSDDSVLNKNDNITGKKYSEHVSKIKETNNKILNRQGETVAERFIVPEGYKRIDVSEGSFADYLRNIKLKPHGAKVKYYDGRTKPLDVHEAVIDIDVGTKDLQQCADSIIRLRAEYLYKTGSYDKIRFNFTNGFNAEYSKWMNGYRINVEGNNAYWVKKTDKSNDYSTFRKYLDIVFAYAGTLSLSKELKAANVEDIRIGDIFIKGGTPGHCVIIMDMAENKKTGKKMFILAQGYMPAQEMHILKNETAPSISPWYEADFGDELHTPEWTFTKYDIKRFE